MEFISNHFDGIATLFTGAFVFVVYALRRRDEKKSAATAILTEIQNAELEIDSLRNTKVIGVLTTVLGINYWRQFGYQIIGKFDFLEQKEIIRFYNACEVAQHRVAFLQAERMNQMAEAGHELQRQIVRMCLEEKDPAVYAQKKTQMTDRFHAEGYWFTQNASKETLFEALNQVQKLSNSPIGQKLKKMARL